MKIHVYMVRIIVVAMALFNNSSCSIVEIFNATMAKVDIEFDIIAYPDAKKTVGKNSTISLDIGAFFLRGINVGVHIGDKFIDNVLSESVSQSLGLGDIKYYIFVEIENIGRTRLIDEYSLAYTFYLIRSPRFLFSGGLVSKSHPIKVRTTNFENFVLENETTSCCVPVCSKS